MQDNKQERDLKGRIIDQRPVVEFTEGDEEGGSGETREKKKTKKGTSGCIKAFFIVMVVILFFLAIMVGGVYWGYRKVLEAGEPVDLGVEYTEQDYRDILEEVGFVGNDSLLCADCPTPVFSDPTEVSVSVNNAQASAAFEYINQYLSNANVSGTQIKMGDGFAELSTVFTYQGNTFPVYMVGSVSRASDRSLNGEITTLKAGGLAVPEALIDFVTDFLLETANERLASAGDTVRIDSIEIKPEGLNFNGLIPTDAR